MCRLLVWLVLWVPVWANESRLPLRDLKFEHLTTKDGLSQNGVFSIVQDHKGFMWFATRGGLNRYDGLRFKHYYRDFNNPNSPSSNQLYDMAIDHHGVLWVGGEAGVFSLDPKTDRVTRRPLKRQDGSDHHPVYAVAVDDRNQVWIGAGEGLFRFDRDTESFMHQPLDKAPFDDKNHSYVTELAAVPGQPGIWVGTYHGLCHYRADQGVGASFTGEKIIKGIPAMYVVSVGVGKNGVLWVGTFGGLRRLDTASGTMDLIPLPFPNPDNGLNIQAVTQDHRGLVWVGESLGLVLYRPEDGAAIVCKPDPADSRSLSGGTVEAIFEDASNIVWVGTFSHGINKFNRSSDVIAHYIRDPSRSMDFNLIMGMYEDPSGMIWLGTYEGFSSLDLETGTLTNYVDDPFLPEGLGKRIVFCAEGSDDGGIWLGSTSGMYRFYPDQRRVQPFFYGGGDPAYQAQNHIRAVQKDSRGRLWVGTDGGLGRLDPSDGNWTFFSNTEQRPDLLPQNQINTLHVTRDDTFWLGLRDLGVAYFDPNTRESVHYAPDPSDPSKPAKGFTLSMELDRDERLWVGSMGGGLSRFNPEDGSFTRFLRTDGLPDEKVFSILADHAGHLWLGTNKGISRFHIQSETFFNLDQSYNLQSNEFGKNSALLTRDGRMLMGGTHGVNVFDPTALDAGGFQPQVVFTQMTVSGIRPELDRDISLMETVALSHESRAITFQFASLDYLAPTKNRFAYRVDGLVPRWTPLEHTSELTFPRLDPGRYLLRVKGTNRGGIYSEKEATLRLIVAPPWWRHPFAYLSYVLGALGLISGYIAYQQRLQDRLKRLVAERTALLAGRNRELQALDQIVGTINLGLTSDAVLDALTEQIHYHFPRADRVSCILYDAETKGFRIAAAHGFEEGNPTLIIAPETLKERFDKATECVAEGVFIGHDYHNRVGDSLPGIVTPEALIALDIHLPDGAGAYLVVVNLQDPDAFRNRDIETLARIRIHAMNALTKAGTIRDLTAARRELIETAHAAGMAELAVEILHNLGNLGNSAKTSSYMMLQKLRTDPVEPPLRRLAELFREWDRLEEAVQKQRAGHMPEYLEKLADRVAKEKHEMEREAGSLHRLLEDLTSTLQAQQKHVREGQTFVRPMELDLMLEDQLRQEGYLMRQENISVVSRLELNRPVLADEVRLKRVISYLLANVREAKRDSDACLNVFTHRDDGRAVLRLEDNGEGIPAENLEKIYRPGFTTRSENRGFGLHYCANALKEMNGEIHITSSGPGTGTTVTIYLPSAPDTVEKS